MTYTRVCVCVRMIEGTISTPTTETAPTTKSTYYCEYICTIYMWTHHQIINSSTCMRMRDINWCMWSSLLLRTPSSTPTTTPSATFHHMRENNNQHTTHKWYDMNKKAMLWYVAYELWWFAIACDMTSHTTATPSTSFGCFITITLYDIGMFLQW